MTTDSGQSELDRKEGQRAHEYTDQDCEKLVELLMETASILKEVDLAGLERYMARRMGSPRPEDVWKRRLWNSMYSLCSVAGTFCDLACRVRDLEKMCGCIAENDRALARLISTEPIAYSI